MTAQGIPTPMSEHARLVIELTRINSEHLRSKSRYAGAEIELEGALAESHGTGEAGARTPQQAWRIELLRERLRDAGRSLHALEAQRASLESQLAGVEAALCATPRRGTQ